MTLALVYTVHDHLHKATATKLSTIPELCFVIAQSHTVKKTVDAIPYYTLLISFTCGSHINTVSQMKLYSHTPIFFHNLQKASFNQ